MVGVLFALTLASMPDVSPAAADGFGLATIVACVFVLLEYGFRQPALLEFRFAAPYNRWRFLTLIAIILSFVVLCGNVVVPTPFNTLITWVAEDAKSVLNFPGSPSVVMRGTLESEVTQKAADMIVPMASLGYLVSFLSSVVFMVFLKFSSWPAREGSFHFWSNLPTFQTIQPENASARLMQVGFLSIGMAFLFPYAIPGFLKAFAEMLPIQSFVGDFALFWIIAFSAWLPCACVMRGIALIKVARMIRADWST
ncbi:MAG: hypothetical protein AAGJ34_02110 [Pseudomonadota bacterium]